MKIGTYNIQCIFETSAYLASFKGSALRGAFGHALKKVSCALKNQNCQSCLLANSCAYSYIFETHQYNQNTRHTHMASRPHPYVLSPQTEGEKFNRGDLLSFTLLLFGDRANEMMPYIIYAISQMGQTGMGRQSRSGAGKFILDKVRQNNSTIFSQQQSQFTSQPSLEDITCPEPPMKPCSEITIHFTTPFRMKYKGHFLKQITFDQLIRGILRRVSALEECYGTGYPQLDYKGLIQRATDITSAQSLIHWQEQKRYSNRQKQAMNFGGLVGSVTFTGDLAEFIPFLKYAEKVHVGKQTAFGLGQINLDAT